MQTTSGFIRRTLLWGTLLALAAFGISCRQKAASGLSQEEADRILATYLEARNTVNLNLLDQIYDPAVVVHDPGVPGDIRSLDSLKAFYAGSHTGFPDFKMTFDRPLVSGDNLITFWTFTGTHTGTLRGLPPTGKAVRFSGVAIDRVVNGKITEEWVYYDMLGVFRQLGFTLVPPSPPTGS